jgi:hypothetical protein
VQVFTSEEKNSGTDSKVTLTVFGDLGSSGPLKLSTGIFKLGKMDEFDVSEVSANTVNVLDPEFGYD